jgi:hypothetical protein
VLLSETDQRHVRRSTAAVLSPEKEESNFHDLKQQKIRSKKMKRAVRGKV